MRDEAGFDLKLAKKILEYLYSCRLTSYLLFLNIALNRQKMRRREEKQEKTGGAKHRQTI